MEVTREFEDFKPIYYGCLEYGLGIRGKVLSSISELEQYTAELKDIRTRRFEE